MKEYGEIDLRLILRPVYSTHIDLLINYISEYVPMQSINYNSESNCLECRVRKSKMPRGFVHSSIFYIDFLTPAFKRFLSDVVIYDYITDNIITELDTEDIVSFYSSYANATLIDKYTQLLIRPTVIPNNILYIYL